MPGRPARAAFVTRGGGRAILLAAACVAVWLCAGRPSLHADPQPSLLATHFLVTWYGHPATPRMGVLGAAAGAERAAALRRQAAAYQSLTSKPVLGAYHLVAVVAQPHAGADGKWRRRESHENIRRLLDEARAHGFVLILDVQPGGSSPAAEVEYLRPFLEQPDVHLAIDPEFTMDDGCVPGRQIGHLHAADANRAIDLLQQMVAARELPPKILILHQFTVHMLPDKPQIRSTRDIDVVLDMDGFGSQSLKLSSYRTVMRQHPLEYPAIKLFYRQDTNLFTPAQVMRLQPAPVLVVYQ
jgi:hypothetical protein